MSHARIFGNVLLNVRLFVTVHGSQSSVYGLDQFKGKYMHLAAIHPCLAYDLVNLYHKTLSSCNSISLCQLRELFSSLCSLCLCIKRYNGPEFD